jgi:BlaI family transcriptional regulator, penicillinase repressor
LLFNDALMSLGELQADILGIVQRLGKASAREVMIEIEGKRHVAYTTVGTVLDRLYHKGLLKRTKVVGRGGLKYLYYPKPSEDIQSNLIQKSLNRLVSAFGPSIVPTIYDNLERISQEEAEMNRKVKKNRR